MRTRVYLEAGGRRTFASAVDWPGWSRSGRGEEAALASLLAYGPRYAAAVRTSIPFSPPSELSDLEVVERVEGGATTDFGAPGEPASEDDLPTGPADLARLRPILVAAWAAFDDAAASAGGAELRKGPRGGGRELPKIVEHVLDAEAAYLALLGRRRPRFAGPEPAVRMAAVREAALQTLAARAADEPVDDPSRSRRSWSPRYFVRRSAWHALDHAWEIEDRVG